MANKNVKITTEELKLSGTLNIDNIGSGVIVLESPDGEIRLDNHLDGFNGSEVEISIKRKLEQGL